MYKTNYSVEIKNIKGDYSWTYNGDQAETAIPQMKSERDVDITYTNGSGMIIPYHAIDSAIIEETREEVEYTDDNAKDCVVPDGGSGETEAP